MSLEWGWGIGFAAVVIALIGAALWGNLAWQPYDAQIKVACIQQGGIYGGGACTWSK